MAQLEDHPLARREMAQHFLHAPPHLSAEQVALRIALYPALRSNRNE